MKEKLITNTFLQPRTEKYVEHINWYNVFLGLENDFYKKLKASKSKKGRLII